VDGGDSFDLMRRKMKKTRIRMRRTEKKKREE
jgi:hypothetical protein